MDPIGIITSANGWQLAAAALTGVALGRLFPSTDNGISVELSSALENLEAEITKSFSKTHGALSRFEEIVQTQRKEIARLEAQLEGLSTGVADDLTEARTLIEALQLDQAQARSSAGVEKEEVEAKTAHALQEAAAAMQQAKDAADLALKLSGKVDEVGGMALESSKRLNEWEWNLQELRNNAAAASARFDSVAGESTMTKEAVEALRQHAADVATAWNSRFDALSAPAEENEEQFKRLSVTLSEIQQWVSEDALVRFAAVEELAKVVQALKTESETRAVTEVDLDRRFEQAEGGLQQLFTSLRTLYAQVDAIVDVLNEPAAQPDAQGAQPVGQGVGFSYPPAAPQQQPDPWTEARLANGGADMGALLAKGRSLQQEFLRRVAERNGEAPVMAMIPSQPL